MIKRLLAVLLVLSLLPVASISAQEDGPPRFINHQGQDLFLNGINLAWIHFAQDTKNFDEVRFVAALDEIGYRGWATAEVAGGDEPTGIHLPHRDAAREGRVGAG